MNTENEILEPEVSEETIATDEAPVTKKTKGAKKAKVVNMDSIAQSTVFHVPVDQIDIDEDKVGYRDDEDVEDMVKKIKAANYTILNNTRGYQKPDGRWFVVHGNRRVLGARKILETEATNVNVPILPIGEDVDEEKYLFETTIGNSQKELTPLEWSKVINGYSQLEYTNKQIAEKTGFSQAYVGQLIRLYNAPSAFKKLIKQEKISATTARKILQGGEEAIQEFLDKWEAEGDVVLFTGGETDKGAGKKEKVTAKDFEINSWKEVKEFLKMFAPTYFSTDKTKSLKEVFTFFVRIVNNEVSLQDAEKFFKAKIDYEKE